MKSTIDETLTHVSFLVRHLEAYNLRGGVIVALMELGVPTHMMGSALVRQAILLQISNPTRALKNDIYAEIMCQYTQVSENQVDQAIRAVIKHAWKYGSKEAWDWYFSYDGRPITLRPTNSEFISRIATILELWQNSAHKGDTL